MTDDLVFACFQHSESSLLGRPEASSVVVTVVFDEDGIIAIDLSFFENSLQVVIVVEIQLAWAVRLVVSDPAYVNPTFREDVHMYGLEAILLLLQRIIYAF